MQSPSIYAHILGLQSQGDETWKSTEGIQVGLNTMSANLLKPERVYINDEFFNPKIEHTD